ncbi:MAG: hypothetical protein H6840_00885 [Planctomycetes bacterium]|nr:hypothetical protein [Planctomycetota bacterium]
MSRTLQKTGLPLALLAAFVLCLPACSGGPEEIWQPETLVQEQPLEGAKFTETLAAGKLVLTATRKVRATETPVERLYLHHTETWSDFDWDSFGLVFWSVLGGIVSVGLYFLFAFVVFDTTKDEENK